MKLDTERTVRYSDTHFSKTINNTKKKSRCGTLTGTREKQAYEITALDDVGKL